MLMYQMLVNGARGEVVHVVTNNRDSEGQQKIRLTAFGEKINELLGDSSMTPTEEA